MASSQRLTAGGIAALLPTSGATLPARGPRAAGITGLSELVDDIRALIDASGAQRVHLVGYDWGATVAWAVAAEIPERLASLTTMSVPHPAAFLKAMATSRQALASWYIYFFQCPAFRSDTSWAGKGMPPDCRRSCSRRLSNPLRLLTAMPAQWPSPECSLPPSTGIARSRCRTFAAPVEKITVPTMYVWSDGDTALLEKGARNCGRYVSGEYRFETLHGSHWMLDEQPDAVAALLSEWLAAHPISANHRCLRRF